MPTSLCPHPLLGIFLSPFHTNYLVCYKILGLVQTLEKRVHSGSPVESIFFALERYPPVFLGSMNDRCCLFNSRNM